MDPLSLTDCRKLIGQSEANPVADEELLRVRDMLYALGDVIVDAFADLNNIDQRTFSPRNDLDDWFEGTQEAQ